MDWSAIAEAAPIVGAVIIAVAVVAVVIAALLGPALFGRSPRAIGRLERLIRACRNQQPGDRHGQDKDE